MAKRKPKKRTPEPAPAPAAPRPPQVVCLQPQDLAAIVALSKAISALNNKLADVFSVLVDNAKHEAAQAESRATLKKAIGDLTNAVVNTSAFDRASRDMLSEQLRRISEMAANRS